MYLCQDCEDKYQKDLPHVGCSMEIVPDTEPQNTGSVIVEHSTTSGKGMVGKLNG